MPWKPFINDGDETEVITIVSILQGMCVCVCVCVRARVERIAGVLGCIPTLEFLMWQHRGSSIINPRMPLE